VTMTNRFWVRFTRSLSKKLPEFYGFGHFSCNSRQVYPFCSVNFGLLFVLFALPCEYNRKLSQLILQVKSCSVMLRKVLKRLKTREFFM
jgi:hypothetical protein